MIFHYNERDFDDVARYKEEMAARESLVVKDKRFERRNDFNLETNATYQTITNTNTNPKHKKKKVGLVESIKLEIAKAEAEEKAKSISKENNKTKLNNVDVSRFPDRSKQVSKKAKPKGNAWGLLIPILIFGYGFISEFGFSFEKIIDWIMNGINGIVISLESFLG
ncbi:hypothetical protein [Mycoplasma sp. P36-A1]|uniref:hypothetical protein n=1 Tax=Mycoplasma sp. P36-A1 TaxID=3252900 RepID=UPI003C2FD1E0